MFENIKERIDIYQSDFGRKFGWDIFFNGILIAELTNSNWLSEAQFWHEYDLNILTKNPELLKRITNYEFWNEDKSIILKYVNKKYKYKCTDALASPLRIDEKGNFKISMRYLYVPVKMLIIDYLYMFVTNLIKSNK